MWLLIAAVVLLFAGIGGWQLWDRHDTQLREKAAASLVADSRESLVSESGDYVLGLAEGAAIGPARELGELLTGTARGRGDDDEITLFKSLGLAAEDLMAARFVYDKATRLGAGTAADF